MSVLELGGVVKLGQSSTYLYRLGKPQNRHEEHQGDTQGNAHVTNSYTTIMNGEVWALVI
ncbi:MAG TPA: hypothetical protein DEP35_07690 [Deltaproteobacteria bacterium]|nr:hypothetical protein [Deltaproteobacteria bacterium]